MTYIRNCFFIFYTFFRFLVIKLFHLKTFNFGVFPNFSPLANINFRSGSKVRLGDFVKAESRVLLSSLNGGTIKIGDNVFLGRDCCLVCWDSVRLFDNVKLGPNVLIYDHDHDFREKDGLKNLKYKTSPVEIGENTWIGANTVILRGTKIGKNCVIGAGSVIKGEFPDDSVIIQRRVTDVIPYNFVSESKVDKS